MTAYAQQYQLGNSWVNIGTGPLTVEFIPGTLIPVQIIVSDTQPAVTDTGMVLSDKRTQILINNATPVWAMAVGNGVWNTASVAVLLGSPSAGGIPPGESHIGEVGGNVKRIVPAIANIAGTAYSTGMVVGGLIELQNAARVANGSGLITSARLGTKISNSSGVQFDLVLFASKPSGVYTDGVALTVAAADLPLVSKVLHISDWTSLGASVSHGQAPAEPRFFQCADTVNSPTSLWGVLVIRGSLTFNTTSDLALSLTVQRN